MVGLGHALWRRILTLWVPSLEEYLPFVDTPMGISFRRLYEEANSSWIIHELLARRWTRLHFIFGLATASLAAISGFGGLGCRRRLKTDPGAPRRVLINVATRTDCRRLAAR